MMNHAPNRRLTKICAAVIGICSLIGSANFARAADTNELDVSNDARLEVYPSESNAMIKGAGTASVWLLFVLIGVVGMGGVFMDAKRKNLE
jgi:hypothetical protein